MKPPPRSDEVPRERGHARSALQGPHRRTRAARAAPPATPAQLPAESIPGRFLMDRRKVALVHVAKGAVHMDDDSYRAMLQTVAGVDSCAALTEATFEAVMQRFAALGFDRGRSPLPPSEKSDAGRRPGAASRAQRSYVRGLWRQWQGRPDDRALGRWLEKYFGVSDVRFASETTARMAIEGLKAMLARKGATRSEAAKPVAENAAEVPIIEQAEE